MAPQRDAERAISDLDRALALDPKLAAAWFYRGTARLHQRDLDRAVADLDRAVELNSTNIQAFTVRGLAWGTKGEWAKAAVSYTDAIKLRPDDAARYHDRAGAWMRLREWGKALDDYDAAVRLEPRLTQAGLDRAWCRASCPDARYRDGAKALAEATRVCEQLEWKNPFALAALAAASAEAGRFEDAVRWQKKALEDPAFVQAMGPQGRQWLASYEQNKPSRLE
ncbi:tetratricopeptide repeat protein [Fimbriiglobus ruber]|uniref:Uncharacterized protein n=1 Tax=Fimbriiglobus ruber TaxID=1908690 RepID=A0A225DYV4_9BACT|nr:tetratricopeptide repeat protein [Fimbriiglobus ruber]OWK43718.1 hypothetical protein FRUB_03317 [Fimbriiglobus ruber]